MKSYSVATCKLVTPNSVSDGALGLKNESTKCTTTFVEVENYDTTKQLEGSSQRTRKGIRFLAYNGICSLITPDTLAEIRGSSYGNLEVSELPNSKLKVQVVGYL